MNIAKAIDLRAGMKALDCGCGVGGPMRTIAKATGAHVTGITINEYQVKRARAHNANAGLATQCTVVQGNFLALPFPPATFDAACVPAVSTAVCHAAVFAGGVAADAWRVLRRRYCIEAACHAPTLVELYSQVFKARTPICI